jgi:hypothetical protein
MDKKFNLGWIIGGLLLAFVSLKFVIGLNIFVGMVTLPLGMAIAFYGLINYTSLKNWVKILLSIGFVVACFVLLLILIGLAFSNSSGFGF